MSNVDYSLETRRLGCMLFEKDPVAFARLSNTTTIRHTVHPSFEHAEAWLQRELENALSAAIQQHAPLYNTEEHRQMLADVIASAFVDVDGTMNYVLKPGLREITLNIPIHERGSKTTAPAVDTCHGCTTPEEPQGSP